MNATETAQLTGPNLADKIDAAVSSAEAEHERAQICLWFDGIAERGEYAGCSVGVEHASVSTHRSGGGIARGGEHLDFQVDLAKWRGWSRHQKVRFAWRLIDAGLRFTAENFGDPSECEDDEDHGAYTSFR
jgi:hypothetical protein